MTERYADVIIDIAHEKVDRVFQYLIPEELSEAVRPGVQVRVPFGRGNQEKTGYVVDISEETDYPPEKMKAVSSVDEKGMSVEGRQIQIAYWLKSNYGSTTIAALKTVLPVKQKQKPLEKKRVVRCLSGGETARAAGECERKHQRAKARVLAALQTEEELPYELIRQKLHVSASTLQALERQGYLCIEKEACYRNPVRISDRSENRPRLNQNQERIIGEVLADYRTGRPGVHLVHGVTGSGKTEVYLGIIEEMIAMGKQAIMLIPEIALTYQTLLRFYKRFGDRVSVINSTLSAGEKYDQIERAKAGEIDVMIGPRSALFTPFANLGVIVVDEEHENSYKSETSPRYHARETAVKIASLCGASVVLGSATPSLEAYYRAASGEYKLYEMKERPGNSVLPAVHTVDLREELKQGNRSIFSRKLKERMQDRLSRGEQTILFLNRRGYAGFISCRSCGHVMKCPHCDVSLSEHRNGMLTCHYCGYQEWKPAKCPSCGSPYLMGFKAGTEQVEEAIHREFPGARVLRMDADTTRRKDSYERILSAFADEEADILVGTQMIVKGHDFPGVTLVGVLAADLSLNRNDYRAGERTFQLLTQAAGRAGRREQPGEVVIQTYQPEHYSVVYATRQDYRGFYGEEIAYRGLVGYPPVEHMLAVLIVSRVQEDGEKLGEEMTDLVKREMADAAGLRVIGPAEAAIGKISDLYRHTFYIRHGVYQTLVEAKDRLENFCRERELKGQTVQFDFDPMNTF
ncbi:MAG: primosomal protein N' [Lachnospiraceae bacterium]|nr:primosomal protein N' [Lachnospiraceae bacterium]